MQFRLLWLLSVRRLQLRYETDRLRLLWGILEPLALAGSYWFLFTQVAGSQVGIHPYSLFALTGILPWMWFANSVREAGSSMRTDAKLLSSLHLSRWLWPVQNILARALEMAMLFPALMIWGVVIGKTQLTYIWLILPAIIMQFVLLVGIAYLLSPLIVLVPDLQRVVGIAVRVLFFLTPVVYLTKHVPDYLQLVIQVNPLSGILSLYRTAFFGVPLALDAVMISAAASASLLLVGGLCFRVLQSRVLKVM